MDHITCRKEENRLPSPLLFEVHGKLKSFGSCPSKDLTQKTVYCCAWLENVFIRTLEAHHQNPHPRSISFFLSLALSLLYSRDLRLAALPVQHQSGAGPFGAACCHQVHCFIHPLLCLIGDSALANAGIRMHYWRLLLIQVC